MLKRRTEKHKSHVHKEQAGNVSWGWKGELKDFFPKKLLPSQANKLTAGNLGACCRPPYEIRE